MIYPAVPSKCHQRAFLGILSEEASSVRVRGGDMATKALLIAGLPLRERAAAQGPFVMNTDAELRDGFNEYRTQGDQYGL